MEQAPEIVDQVIQVLADRFGTTGAHLWGALMRQAVVQFVVWLVAFVATAAAGVAVVWAGLELVDDEDGSALVGTAGCLILCVAIGCLFAALASLPGALNPEYFALQKILGALP